MLKIYDPIYYVFMDGGPWERLEDPFDTNWFVTDEDLPETELLLDDVSFQEAYDYLRDNYISGVRTCRTIFKNKPQLSLLYFNTIDRKYIKKCERFSLIAKNKLRKNVTLDWILKHLEADQAIQYFKERGIKMSDNKDKVKGCVHPEDSWLNYGCGDCGDYADNNGCRGPRGRMDIKNNEQL